MKLLHLIILAFSASAVFAESADQTDWAGGSVEPGPVLEWTDSFSSSDAIEFTETPGSVFLSLGNLTDAAVEIDNSNLYSIGAYPGDVDMDGDIDILAASAIDNQVLWWENLDGQGTSWQAHPIASDLAGAWGAVCADIDNDGDQDVFGSAKEDDVVLWWENTDGTATSWTEHMIDSSFDGAKAITAVDMDEDGNIDIAASAKTDNMVVWYRNNGSGSSWTKNVIVSDYLGANSVYAFDFDEDGDWDILSAAKSDKAVRWFENTNGIGTSWTEHSVGEDFNSARTAEACDIDGDGDVDVLGTGGISKSSGVVCWWENTDGSGTSWTQHVINGEFPGPYTVLHCDMDQDGDQDAVSGSLTENAIYWWENKEAGAVWEEHVLCNYFAPRTVSAADIDGDGTIEIFAGSLYSFNITWWKTYGHQPQGSLVSSILDTGEDAEWVDLEWAGDIPSGTSLGISMRSSWDSEELGEWSDTVFTSPYDLSSLINDNDRFVQYSIVMQTESPETTPSLENLEISWNPLSIGSAGESETLLRVEGGNPLGNSPLVICTLPETGTATLTIYDLSGRAVFTTGERVLPGGTSEFRISRLSDGVYFAGLQSEEGRIATRFTIINRL